MIEKIKYFWMRYWLIFAWIAVITMILLTGGCTTNKTSIREKQDSVYVDKTYWRDTTIFVAIPYEKLVEVCPAIDTLQMESSVALSVAWLDTATFMLRGTLVSKKNDLQANVKIPTRTITNTVYRDVNKVVEVHKKISFMQKVLALLTFFIGFGFGLLFLPKNKKK